MNNSLWPRLAQGISWPGAKAVMSHSEQRGLRSHTRHLSIQHVGWGDADELDRAVAREFDLGRRRYLNRAVYFVLPVGFEEHEAGDQ